jgi:CspA family cold shock protein
LLEVVMVRTGRVLRFDEVRGYGFIVPDGGGEDVFVHANELLDEKAAFSAGTPVEFEVTQGDRGLKAFAVRIVETERVSAAAAVPVTEAAATTQAAAQPSAQSTAQSTVQPEEDDGLCDVLSSVEFVQELTELLLGEIPELTGVQIVDLRRSLLVVAQKHGWVES